MLCDRNRMVHGSIYEEFRTGWPGSSSFLVRDSIHYPRSCEDCTGTCFKQKTFCNPEAELIVMNSMDITEKKEFRLRPHHGMCLAFFEGKGYSSEFTAHMAKMKEILTEQNPMITLVRETDDICCACPHNKEGVCDAAQKVYEYDTGVLENCGLKENEKQPFLTFYRQVAEQILDQGIGKKICGNCQWRSICYRSV